MKETMSKFNEKFNNESRIEFNKSELHNEY
jgi:hypothetical protein